ncbi:MAG: hypothetical protein KAR31_06925 [Candidatus Omnitrophica bacterium]|nr:hypothetical protein [Candidatus Omnitrophota bacterium]
MRKGCNVLDALYNEYKEDIQKAPEIYDRYLFSNKVEIAFNTIDDATLKIILDAVLNMARKLKG